MFTRGVTQQCSGEKIRRIKLENVPTMPLNSSLKIPLADQGSGCMSSSACMHASTDSSSDWRTSSTASRIRLNETSQPSWEVRICEYEYMRVVDDKSALYLGLCIRDCHSHKSTIADPHSISCQEWEPDGALGGSDRWHLWKKMCAS